MKSINLTEYNNLDSLKIIDEKISAPKANEVQIKLISSSINPLDWKIADGDLKDLLKFENNIALGWDFYGEITKVGSEESFYKEGMKVLGMQFIDHHATGTFKELINIKTDYLSAVPKELESENLGAISLAALTALQSVSVLGNVLPNQRVLIHAGSGGVGHFAIQIAKGLGAYVITTASKNNFDFVKSLGADLVIDYKENSFEKVVSNVDFVLDSIGGDNIEKSLMTMNPNTTLVSLLGYSESDLEIASEKGIKLFHHIVSPKKEDLKKLIGLIETKGLKVNIGAKYKFDQIKEALLVSKKGGTQGKILITV